MKNINIGFGNDLEKDEKDPMAIVFLLVLFCIFTTFVILCGGIGAIIFKSLGFL